MSDFLYEFSYLIHCKHFINVFPSIVIATLKNMNFFSFIKKKKQLKMSAAIFHFFYVQLLQNEPFNEIRGTVGSISDWVSEKFHFVTTWSFSTKMCQIVIISRNFAQFEKLNFCIVCYFTNHQNSRVSKFILYHLQS